VSVSAGWVRSCLVAGVAPLLGQEFYDISGFMGGLPSEYRAYLAAVWKASLAGLNGVELVVAACRCSGCEALGWPRLKLVVNDQSPGTPSVLVNRHAPELCVVPGGCARLVAAMVAGLGPDPTAPIVGSHYHLSVQAAWGAVVPDWSCLVPLMSRWLAGRGVLAFEDREVPGGLRLVWLGPRYGPALADLSAGRYEPLSASEELVWVLKGLVAVGAWSEGKLCLPVPVAARGVAIDTPVVAASGALADLLTKTYAGHSLVMSCACIASMVLCAPSTAGTGLGFGEERSVADSLRLFGAAWLLSLGNSPLLRVGEFGVHAVVDGPLAPPTTFMNAMFAVGRPCRGRGYNEVEREHTGLVMSAVAELAAVRAWLLGLQSADSDNVPLPARTRSFSAEDGLFRLGPVGVDDFGVPPAVQAMLVLVQSETGIALYRLMITRYRASTQVREQTHTHTHTSP
jgi:hypothetical protein